MLSCSSFISAMRSPSPLCCYTYSSIDCLLQDKVTRDKVLFVSDRHSPATRKIIEDTLGDIARLPIETNIDGAKTKFDYEAYVRDDPFVHPMRAALRNAGLLHGTTTEAANVQTEAETSVSDKGAAAPTLTTSRWRFW